MQLICYSRKAVTETKMMATAVLNEIVMDPAPVAPITVGAVVSVASVVGAMVLVASVVGVMVSVPSVVRVMVSVVLVVSVAWVVASVDGICVVGVTVVV